MTELKKNEFAIASLVLGMISFVSIFGLEKPIAAIVFGVLALNRMRAEHPAQGGKNLAIIGIALGSVALVLGIFFLIKYFPQFIQMQQQMIRTR